MGAGWIPHLLTWRVKHPPEPPPGHFLCTPGSAPGTGEGVGMSPLRQPCAFLGWKTGTTSLHPWAGATIRFCAPHAQPAGRSPAPPPARLAPPTPRLRPAQRRLPASRAEASLGSLQMRSGRPWSSPGPWPLLLTALITDAIAQVIVSSVQHPAAQGEGERRASLPYPRPAQGGLRSGSTGDGRASGGLLTPRAHLRELRGGGPPEQARRTGLL